MREKKKERKKKERKKRDKKRERKKNAMLFALSHQSDFLVGRKSADYAIFSSFVVAFLSLLRQSERKKERMKERKKER